MLLEKEEYKKLHYPYILSKNKIEKIIKCSGHNGINVSSPVSVDFTNIGIFIDKVMGQKAFIKIETIANVDIGNNTIYIDSNDRDAPNLQLIFNKKDFKATNTAFYFLCEQLGKPIPDSFKRDIVLPITKGTLSANFIEQKKELINNNQIFCPKCLSTQITALNSKPSFLNGYSSVMITCLNCGHKFKPGQK